MTSMLQYIMHIMLFTATWFVQIMTSHLLISLFSLIYSMLHFEFSAPCYLQEDPFMSYQPETLFNISRFLMNETKNINLKGVSKL